MRFDVGGRRGNLRENCSKARALKAVCAEDERFPSPGRARQWLWANEAFAVQYASACEERLSAWEDDILLLADDIDSRATGSSKSSARSKPTAPRSPARNCRSRRLRRCCGRTTRRNGARRSPSLIPNRYPFAGLSLERIEEAARAAELEEIVEQKRALDRENERRRAKGEALLDFAAFLALRKGRGAYSIRRASGGLGAIKDERNARNRPIGRRKRSRRRNRRVASRPENGYAARPHPRGRCKEIREGVGGGDRRTGPVRSQRSGRTAEL